MSKENKSIHEFDLNLICEYFSNMERQGPGSPAVTIKAADFIDHLKEESRIIDIGCGTGGQTMTLAQHLPGKITGLDLFPLFIDLFNQQAKELNLEKRVKGITGSMADLPFQENEFDLIWSEGAIYNIGFERGLREWRKYLKKGGYIAVSEACWFTYNRPEEIQKFWMSEYPGIDTIPNNINKMQNAGYIPVASFVLPEECWTKHFYALQEKAKKPFLSKYKGNKTAEELVANQEHEAELYSKYKEYYGYAFYIGKKL